MSVYYVLAPELGTVKIGFAEKPKSRFSKIQSDCPTRLILLAIEDGDETTEGERHARFADYRQRGEWFRHEGELLEYISTLAPVPAKVPSLNARLIAVGISKTYASQILSGKQRPAISLAIHIFRETGWRHARIADLTEGQMAVFEEVDPWTPRQDATDQSAAA